jgi:hypothetical protein
MLNIVSSAAMGFFAKASCDMVPKVSWRSNAFKLSFCISSYQPPSQDNHKLAQRPFVTVVTSDKKKKTELGTWSQQQGEWQFRETITLEVMPDEEVTIQVCCSQQYDLGIAALELASSVVGEVCFPVSSVLPKLQPEERDLDGFMHATQVMGFDLLSKGARTGRLYVSMETRQLPSQQKGGSNLAFADMCMNTKAIADKDPNTNLGFGNGPSRDRMHYDRARSEQYPAAPDHLRQPSRDSQWR